MPDRGSIHYFGAGPAPLPTAVLRKAGDVMLNYNDLGVGICEMSHRSADANGVLSDTKAALTELLHIPTDTHEIVFFQGGGSGQFSAATYHMTALWVARRKAEIESRIGAENEAGVLEELKAAVDNELRLDYIVTGSWSLKASQEAQRLLGKKHVNVAADSRTSAGRNGHFGDIPDEDSWKLSKNPAMVYFCDNETVDGVEFPAFPDRLQPTGPDGAQNDPLVVCDMSSNYISRPVDVSKYAVIFGGAQKNIGVAGVSIVIIKKSILAGQTASPDLLRSLGMPVAPTTYDWLIVAKNNSLYNTLPIFDVWVAGEVMRDLISALGPAGLTAQSDIVDRKSDAIYSVLEKYPSSFEIVPERRARSRMNLCFRLVGGDVPALEKQFLAGAQSKGLMGIKGHRSVGGMRISNYNAVPMEAIEKLVVYLDDFAAGKTA